MEAGARAIPSVADSVVIVPAGGSGTRLGAKLPKQYLTLDGVPVLVRTLRALARARSVAGAVAVVPADRVAWTRALVARHRLTRQVSVVAGGAHRQESVWNGLQSISMDVRWVVVHDGVRPFADAALVERVLDAARVRGAAICGLPVRETVKRVREAGREGLVDETLDREGLWLVQTPQAFRRELLWEAHDKARRDGFVGTDDAALVERLGVPVAMVLGAPENLKITTRDDLRAARRFLRAATERERTR